MPEIQTPIVETPDYTEEELNYRAKVIAYMDNAKTQREDSWTEFNDMDYLTYHETNAKAANSYIRPKDNKDDTRVVTGTTEEKEHTLISALLNYNLEPNMVAFDTQDLEIHELGENMEEMVKKSREIEDYDDQRPLILKEMLDQGTVFVEELWAEEFRFEKTVDFDSATGKGKVTSKKLKKAFEGCRVNLLSGLSVYLGNIREFDLRKQPFIATVTKMPYEQAKTIYGKWAKFKYVNRKVAKLNDTDGSDTLDYYSWTLTEDETDMVEIVKYYNKPLNEFNVFLNGVMMLPTEFPLTSVSPSGEYPIAKGGVEPISKFFAYSKSIPAKTKVDQQVLDEMLKLIILKTQQSFKPPMANNTNRVLSKNIWSPGTTHRNIDPTKLVPIITATGVTASEFNAFQFIKNIVDQKSVSPAFAGENAQGNQTATEVIELKKQQMMKLGLIIWGVMSLERQLSWLRLQNILANWTKPIDQKVDEIRGEIVDVYRTITTSTSLESGVNGKKIIEFNPEMASMLTPDNIKEEEKFLSESMQTPVRKVYMNPEVLKTVKATWYITITPTEKDTTELQRVLFTQNIKDAMVLFGPQSLNIEYIKERFAVLAKEDPKRFWSQTPQQPQVSTGQEQAMGGDIGQQLVQGAMQPAQQPSLNTLLGK
jgi:hypothetical protein